jgi:UDP-N-acetylmuramate dehydrogenase
VWRPGSWFEYGYRTSRLKKQSGSRREWIVLGAELRLVPAPIADIEARMQQFGKQRKESQPPGATVGSMFKNPPGDYAGRLIEAAGLKGYRVGQAEISRVHANFFQNLEGATATEVLELIKMARTAVKDRFGVELELEIEVVGEFESETF